MELIVSIVSGLASVGAIVLVSRAYLKRVHELETLYERTHVSPENPILPEAHIMRFAPVPITIHGKTLYLQPLTADGHKAYTAQMVAFLSKYHQQLGALRWALLGDLLNDATKSEALKEWQAAMNNAGLHAEMQEMIARTFLRSKAINPHRLTLRQMRKTWTWLDTLQLWQMMWQVQVKSCQDFIEYLLTGQAAGTGNASPGSPLQRRPAQASQKYADGRLMPRYSRQKGQAKKINGSMIN